MRRFFIFNPWIIVAFIVFLPVLHSLRNPGGEPEPENTISQTTSSGTFPFDFNRRIRDSSDLQYDFYNDSCPQAEDFVRSAVIDCFIQGCDASLLLEHEGENKQKNMGVEGINRKVLQDIQNLVINPADLGANANVTKRLTRAQLAALAQAAAEKNKNFVPATRVEHAQKPAEPEVIVISSDEESEEVKEKQAVRERKIRERSTKKIVKTFSSVLSARSKAACRVVPKELVENIDVSDKDNELAATEYIDDIYKYYKLSEDDVRVHDYMGSQPDINAKMRAILINWLIEVHRKFELMPETFYLTLNIVDRFLSTKAVPRKELQLVGISSMLIASKYEEIWAPEVSDFVCISDNAYVREQVLVMEKTILRNLEWYLTVPTPYVFLVRYIKASTPSDKEMENMVNFLAELSMMHYATVSSYKQAIPNQTLKGFDEVNLIKEEAEQACPGVVSCADILALAARDSVLLGGGPFYPVLTGRRDSLQSCFQEATDQIPRPDDNITRTLHLFNLRGFNASETVSLLGGHNIGKIGCDFIQQRLYDFQGTGQPDPSIPLDFLSQMRLNCPDNLKNNISSNNTFSTFSKPMNVHHSIAWPLQGGGPFIPIVSLAENFHSPSPSPSIQPKHSDFIKKLLYDVGWGLLAFFLLLLSGVMSGLTISFMSLDELKLYITSRGENLIQREIAVSLLKVLRNKNRLLVTLLLWNALGAETLPVCLEEVFPKYIATAISILCVLMFGEILPQALFHRHKLRIAFKMIGFIKILMRATTPVSWVFVYILNKTVKAEPSILLNREELRALIELHGTNAELGGDLLPEQIKNMLAAMDASDAVDA